MSIQEHLNKIRNARYGREVRESIAKGIETAYDDASEKDNANMEVKIARGTHPNLRSRLEEVDNKQQQTTAQLAQKLTKNRGDVDIPDLSQNVKEIINGDRPLPIAEVDSILTENIVNGQVTPVKLSAELQNQLVFVENLVNGRGDNRDDWGYSVVEGVANLRTESGYFIVNTANPISIYHPVDFNAGDKLYVSTNYYTDGQSPTTLLQFTLSQGSTSVDSNRFSLNGSQTSETHSSAILSPKASGNRMHLIRQGVGSKYVFKSVVVINLTQTFGKGNEPSQPYVDRFIRNLPENYFSGEIMFPLTDYLLQKKDSNDLFLDIVGTTQVVVTDEQGEVERIEHVKTDGTIVREDVYTIGVNNITEQRTLSSGETLTYIYNLNDYTVEVI